MNKFIIGSGYDSEPDIVYAPSLEAARQKAVALSLAKGLDPEDAALEDFSWAVAWDYWTARDLGVLFLDEREANWAEKEARA